MNGRERSEQATMNDPAQTSELASRLLRLLPRLQQWAASTVQANRGEHDLSLRQFAVLYLIREGEDSPSALARRLRISPAVVTGLLDRLEQHGFLRRRMDPGDRRRLRLELTESGQAASLAVGQMLSREIAQQLDRAPAADLAALAQALGLLEQTVSALERDSPRLGPVPVEVEEPWDAADPVAGEPGGNGARINAFDGDDDDSEAAAVAG
jgi:DNA-binding MarR family transcriptional regulator